MWKPVKRPGRAAHATRGETRHAAIRQDPLVTTIADVAKHAGVSMKTVSRVLNQEPHVREEVRERVRKAAAELRFQPSQSARRLAGKRSFLIAFLYDNPNPAYVSAVQAGAAKCCRALGYHLVVEPIDLCAEGGAEIVGRLVGTLAPDGVILTPPLSDDAGLIAALARTRTRMALIGGDAAGADVRIVMDERAAGRALTEHLLTLGHRRIGFVRGHPHHAAAARRYDGYRDAHAQAGLSLAPELVAQGYFDLQSGVDAGRALLGLDERPTAIFSANDEMAIGVLIAAREQGLSVPEEVSIAGFDDTPISRHVSPSLTTVRQPLEDMGRLAVEGLLDPSGHARAAALPFQLEVRTSTAAPRPQATAERVAGAPTAARRRC